MKKAILILATLFTTTIPVLAQNDTPFEKEYFPNNRDALRVARDHMKAGDKIFNTGNNALFNLALSSYRLAWEFNPNNSEVNYKLGVCYLYSPHKRKALPHLEQSFKLNPNYDGYNIHYLLGRAYQLNEQWDKAAEHYRQQLEVLRAQKGTEPEFKLVRKHIQEVEHGKQLVQNPERVWIDNLGPAINSAAPEYAPLISTDESLLIITARREGTTGNQRDETDNLPNEDLYFSRNTGGVWSQLANMGDAINGNGHDASSGLSPDGKTLFVFKGTLRGGGDIYQSNFVNGAWTTPKALDKNVNTPYHESSASLSYDGKRLFFVSEREGGMGGRDIWMSRWDAKKQGWGPAENLGGVVNSEYDEDGVYLHPDGTTLYFSSKGHNSMGGNDIFYSEYKDGRWQTPVNIGYPINTPDDDVFFIVAADGRTAYYSSIRDEGYGDKDIYRITFLGPEKQPVLNTEELLYAARPARSIEVPLQPEVKIRTSRMTLLKGLVLDDATGLPVEARIDLIDNRTSAILASFNTEAATGAYIVSLPAGRNYGIHVNADKYLFNSLNFDIPDTAYFREFYKVIRLKRIKIGESIVLRNIFFDYNAFTIRPESEAELERLYKLITENPQIKVEISGHTDNVGGDKYNQDLSENRARAVVEWLRRKGVPDGRLIYKGYGKTQPIASNDTPEGRQENRRTEFKIIE
jgi:outer membrane protein OmpA-like peptidoglycan-associated protein